jgi:hypothetical protein
VILQNFLPTIYVHFLHCLSVQNISLINNIYNDKNIAKEKFKRKEVISEQFSIYMDLVFMYLIKQTQIFYYNTIVNR